MKADETAADGTRGALIVTGADAPLGAAVVAAACQTGRSVIACGSDHVALGEVASRDVVSLTLASSDPDQLRVVLAVAIDRFGGVAGVVHAEGHGHAPRTAGEVGGRLVGVQALVDALPPSTPHVIAVEESGRSSDPVAPLRAAAAAALSAWARSAAGMVRV
ncbi:MAG: hypothetical protein VX000_09720, partial [Myxococcota bacterium]|nr:hypothetical protein [Myxococcota bacterium]